MNTNVATGRSIVKGQVRTDLLLEETLVDLFKNSVYQFLNKTALIFEKKDLTYAQLNKWSDAIAADLLQKGIGRGSCVAVWLPRGLELHAAILGIIKSGAAYVPVDREMPAERVELVLAEVKAVACFSHFALNTNSLILSVIPLPEGNQEVGVAQGPQPDDCAYILYTSGSTGKPKGIPISHRQICHLVRAEQSILNIQSDDRVYQGFSVSFDMWCEETWISYFAGATLWIADNTTSKAIDELAEVLSKQKITVLHAVPSLLAVIEDDVPTLRIINAGGEACTTQVVNKWAKPGRMFYNSYGPTETTVSATITQLQPGDPITIGNPLPNYNLAVIDDNKNILPRGEKGELIISGPGVSNGYIDLPELTHKKFLSKPDSLAEMPGNRIYLTGDAAIINEDGSIDFQGRLDDQVKLRGYRIELGEIEIRLHEQQNVTAAAVAVKKDNIGQEHLIGYVLLEDEICSDENGLRTELAKILPPYMVPEAIITLKEMPRMPSGKVNRNALPLPDSFHLTEQETASEAIDMNAPLEDRILAVLHKSFPGKSISLSQDFFTDLGGHSLLAAGFVSRLRREGGVPYASLKDIYIHRPLQTLAAIWAKGPQTNASEKRIFNPIPRLRFYLCGLAQTIALFFVFGLFTVEVFGPFVSYYYMSEETETYYWGIIAAIVFYCLIPPIFIATVVAIKWLVIGKMKEGDYPLWGTYYFRWWFVKTMQRLLPSQFMNGTPLYPFFLRMFGAHIASDAQLSNITIGAEDLVTIGSDASLSSQVVLDNAFVEDGLLKLRSIHLGAHSYIGSSAVIAGNTIVEDYGELQDLSYLPAGNRIKEGEVWYGSPAQLKETKNSNDLPKPEIVSFSKKITYRLIFLLMLFVFPIFILIPLLPIIIAIHAMDNASADYNFNYIVTVPVLAFFYMYLFVVETVLFTRLLNINIKPGKYSVYSIRYVRKWLSDQFMTLSLIVLHPIYATVYVAGFFRLLGAKVGKNTEISTASSVTHPLLEIGDDAFVADAVTLGEADVRAQQLILDKTIIQHNSFVGNSALIPQGYNLPPNMLIGVLSVPPSAEQLQTIHSADWFGSPAIALPRRQESNPFPKTLTTSPTLLRRLSRSIIEFIRIILPETVIICCSIFFIAYGHDLIVDRSMIEIVLLLPLYYLGFVGIPALLVTALLKWIFIGKYKAQQKPMWTSKVWRSEAITSTYEALCVPFLLDFLRGTPWLPMALRLMGTRTGKRVWMNTTDITEFDMVSIGTDSALNEDSGPQTHLFEDRVMKVGRIKIGERCSIGARSIILYNTRISNDVKIDALSLVMKGEVLSPKTNWIGSPIKPI
jgi:non-ribosomal peptide synthetase-like protein